ncbi:MAG: hypothetical protein WC825_03765 [Gallionellaceae bacterium]
MEQIAVAIIALAFALLNETRDEFSAGAKFAELPMLWFLFLNLNPYHFPKFGIAATLGFDQQFGELVHQVFFLLIGQQAFDCP